jgi:hypothetical protein
MFLLVLVAGCAGQRNELCTNSGECEFGLYCKDRGDGLRVCR